MRIGERIIPPISSKPWIAGSLSGLNSSEEGLQGKIYSLLSVLKNLGEHLIKIWLLDLPIG